MTAICNIRSTRPDPARRAAISSTSSAAPTTFHHRRVAIAVGVWGVVAAGVTVGWSGPVRAASATAVVEGARLVVTGSAQADSIYVTVRNATSIRISLDGTMQPADGCAFEYDFTDRNVICSSSGFTRIVVRSLGGNDYVQVSEEFSAPAPIDAEIHLGPGDDRVASGGGDDVIDGDDGNDTQLNGGRGADVIRGGPGDDSGFVGDGSGNGWDPSEFAPDVIDGGPGFDTADEGRVSSDGRVHFWSLDGRANDGADLDRNIRNGAEEGDNLLAIEEVDGSTEQELFVGNNDRNVFYGYSGDDVFDAKGGDDEIYGGFGDTVIDAGPGDDEVVANGVMDLGPGRDIASGGGGPDLILAGDGEQDQIDCGAGADILYADEADIVTSDFTTCELRVGEVSRPTLTSTAIVLRVTVANPGRTTVTFTERGGLRTSATKNVSGTAGRPVTFQLPIPTADQARLLAAGRVAGTVTTSVRIPGMGEASASRRVTARR